MQICTFTKGVVKYTALGGIVMKIDIVNPTLARIYTANENIKGMLERLAVIMDKKGYQELHDKYLKLAKEIPEDEILTELEKKYNQFGTDLRYGSLDVKLKEFEKELDMYNGYKEFSDLLNKIKSDTAKAFEKDFLIDEYVLKNKEFIDMLLNLKESKTIQQFTGLFGDANKALFNSLKTLTLVGNKELISYINETNSDYLKEHLASEVRKSIDTTSFEGSLDEDYVDFESLYECAVNDEEIITRQEEARSYEERQLALAKERDERVKFLEKKIRICEENIKKYQATLKKLKLSKTGLKARKMALRFVVVPALAIPLSCPFIGRHIGLKESAKVILTKTITNMVDADSGEIISTEEDFSELKTDYVASVTICEPWKKNVSGTSYTRDCVVYDYDFSDLGDLEDDFHLTIEDIKPESLIKKYTYQEPTGEVKNPKYLTEEQIYITETYQDASKTEISTKYNIPYTVAGSGVGVLLGTAEVAAYLYAGKKFMEKMNLKVDKKLSVNNEAVAGTNRNIKLDLEDQAQAKKEYEVLTKKR